MMNKQSQLKIFAHRGASSLYPENTMAAFYQALTDGVDGIELDVHLTRDQHLVVIHDETIDRTSTGKGFIHQMTLEQLRQYNYCGKFAEHYPDTWFELPLLSDVLNFLTTNDLQCNIELKTDQIHYKNIEQQVIALVDNYQLQSRVIYSSFNIESLVIINQINPNLNTALLTDTLEDIVTKLQYSGAKGLHLDYRAYDSSVQQLSYPIRLWTINDSQIVTSYLSLPVETIMTDNTQQVMAILKCEG